jgi:hypothetical protein
MTENTEAKHERRHSHRVEAHGNVPGQLNVDLETNVLQLSPGGMMVDIEVPLPVGSEHQFTLNLDNQKLDLKGVVRNCHSESADEKAPRYHIGIEFCNLTDQEQAILTRVVEENLEA